MILIENYNQWCEWCLLEFGKVPTNIKNLKGTTIHPLELQYGFPQIQGICYSYDLSIDKQLINFLIDKKDVMFKLKTFNEYRISKSK